MAIKKREMLLIMLMEECDEVSQRASKAIRFTMDEVQEGQNLTNSERLIYEFNDLVAVMETIFDSHYEDIIDPHAIKLKKDKIEKWLEYSRKQKTLE